jgi:hypothetical protein
MITDSIEPILEKFEEKILVWASFRAGYLEVEFYQRVSQMKIKKKFDANKGRKTFQLQSFDIRSNRSNFD